MTDKDKDKDKDKDIVLYMGAGFDLTPLISFDSKFFIFSDIDANIKSSYIELTSNNKHKVVEDTRYNVTKRNILRNLEVIQVKYNGFEIINEIDTSYVWYVTFKNGINLIYIFMSYPYPKSLLIPFKDIFDNISIIYVDGFFPCNDDVIKSFYQFKKFHTIYWGKSTKNCVNLEKIFPDKKIIYSTFKEDSDINKIVTLEELLLGLRSGDNEYLQKFCLNDLKILCQSLDIKIHNNKFVDYTEFIDKFKKG